jgi:hypothetical protein
MATLVSRVLPIDIHFFQTEDIDWKQFPMSDLELAPETECGDPHDLNKGSAHEPRTLSSR